MLLVVVEKNCFSDKEFKSIVARVPHDAPLDTRFRILAALAETVVSEPAIDFEIPDRLHDAFILAAREAVASGNTTPLAEVMKRIDDHRPRVEAIDARRNALIDATVRASVRPTN